MITLLGLSALVGASALTVAVAPTMGVAAPWWAYVVAAGSVFFYLHMDCLDGKQARRTGTSSPLGQLFDHGCDALALVAIVSLLQTALPLVPCSRYAGLATLVAYAPWLLAHWEEYHTGTMSYSSGWWGVTEANLAVVALLLVTGLAGPGVWDARPLAPALAKLDLLRIDAPAFHAAASNASQILSEYAVIKAQIAPAAPDRTLPVSVVATLADPASPLAAVNLTALPTLSLASAKRSLDALQAAQRASVDPSLAPAAAAAALDPSLALVPSFDARLLLAGPARTLVDAVTAYLDLSPAPTWAQAVAQARGRGVPAGAPGAPAAPSFFALLAPAAAQALASPRAVVAPLLASLRLADLTLLFLAFNGFVMAANQVVRVLALSRRRAPGTGAPGGALEPDERGAKSLGVLPAALHLAQILLLVSGTYFATRSLRDDGYGYNASLGLVTGAGAASPALAWAGRAQAALRAAWAAAPAPLASLPRRLAGACPRSAAALASLAASLTAPPTLASLLEGARVRAAVFGLGYALCASRLILAHMAKQPWDLRGPAFFGVLAAALNERLRLAPQALLLPALAALQLAFYLSYVVVEIRQICTALGINALTIPTKKHTKKD